MIWYEEEVQTLEEKISRLKHRPGLVFYGSSTIRLWESLEADFKACQPLNLGFGGSTLEACVFFYQRLLKGLQPDKLVIYAGDNDLGDGKSPEAVFGFFLQLCQLIHKYHAGVPVTYISIKPSIARWDIRHKIQYANKLIREAIPDIPGVEFIDLYSPMVHADGTINAALFDEDGLHLSKAGYALWKKVLLTHSLCKNDEMLT
ncbi:MAG: GDSL-type esterase/lipase family protein [Chitinophagaceae bacterium]|nr:GDSL-type esterase/lipase family protein [Chitinophagaceae bacterium]